MSNDNNPWSVPAPQESYPTSQGSASYPASQGSASYPATQQSASYPGSQPSASYPTGQASAPYDGGATVYSQPQQPAPYAGQDQGQFAQQHPAYVGQQQGYAGAPAPRQSGGLATLFDFSMTRHATTHVAKVFNILCLILAVAMWLLPAIAYFMLGARLSDLLHAVGQNGSNDFVIYGLLQVFLGWIPALAFFIFTRMLTEFFLHHAKHDEENAAAA